MLSASSLVRGGRASVLAALLFALLLGLSALGPALVAAWWWWGEDPQQIVVKNAYGASYVVTIVFTDGSSETYSSSAAEYTIEVTRDIDHIIFDYTVGDVSVEYVVYPQHTSTIYLLTFPPWFRLAPEDQLGGTATTTSVKVYSWYDIESEDNPWPDAPYGLEYMVGTEGCYVEEAVAGRVFILFYGFAYEHVKDILDELGIEDEHTRYEIAATALWAAQMVREVKGLEPDYDLCHRAAIAILMKYYGYSRLEAELAFLALWPLCSEVRYKDNATLYKAILYGIKSDETYISIFPEWQKVDEEHWVEMCTRLEQYTVYPLTPTYVHILVAGAYANYPG